MAEAMLLPLDSSLPLTDPAPNYIPLAQRALAVGFLALVTLMFGLLWYVAVRRRRTPTAGYAWSTGVLGLLTIIAAILAFWRPTR